MTEYALLVLPAVNRVYGQAAPALTAAELAAFGETVLVGRVAGIGHREIGGVPYVTFSAADGLTDRDVRHLSNLSSAYALFEAGPGDALRPVTLHRLDRYDDDLLTIPRYTGKTNESFTKLLLNLALVCSRSASDRYLDDGGRVHVLDPLCGRGTTLHQAFMYGCDAAGVEVDAKAVDAYETFFVQWLQEKRIKHKVDLRTAGYRSTRFDACRETARQNGWDVQDISCAHDMMIDEPQHLAHILTTLAGFSEKSDTSRTVSASAEVSPNRAETLKPLFPAA